MLRLLGDTAPLLERLGVVALERLLRGATVVRLRSIRVPLLRVVERGALVVAERLPRALRTRSAPETRLLGRAAAELVRLVAGGGVATERV